MAHSPVRMLREFHSKHVLVVGQGPVYEIANTIGFKSVTTIEDLRHAFPSLDAVDHKRRRGEMLQPDCLRIPRDRLVYATLTY